MARKRMIDPRIWQSEQIAMLTRDQRLLFIGIVSNADDEGRLKGSPLFLKLTVFPGDMDVTLEDVREWRDAIANAKDGGGQAPIRVYTVNGIEYIDLPNWKRYQRIDRPSPSDLPAFDEHSTNIRRTFDEDSTNIRRAFDEDSTSVPGAFDEHSTNVRSEENRKEEKGNESESHTRAASADALPEPLPSTKRPTRRTNGPALAPLVDAFRELGLADPLFEGGEARAAQSLLRHFSPGDVAACWRDIATGAYGDDWERRNLSFAMLLGNQRMSNWRRWRDSPQPSARASPDWGREMQGIDRRRRIPISEVI